MRKLGGRTSKQAGKSVDAGKHHTAKRPPHAPGEPLMEKMTNNEKYNT